jgi:glycogen operon protein
VKDKKFKDDYFYFAYNMHWEKHDFDLPKLPDGLEWKVLFDTSKEGINDGIYDDVVGSTLTVNDRCVVVLVSVQKQANKAINADKKLENVESKNVIEEEVLSDAMKIIVKNTREKKSTKKQHQRI